MTKHSIEYYVAMQTYNHCVHISCAKEKGFPRLSSIKSLQSSCNSVNTNSIKKKKKQKHIEPFINLIKSNCVLYFIIQLLLL